MNGAYRTHHSKRVVDCLWPNYDLVANRNEHSVCLRCGLGHGWTNQDYESCKEIRFNSMSMPIDNEFYLVHSYLITHLIKERHKQKVNHNIDALSSHLHPEGCFKATSIKMKSENIHGLLTDSLICM